MVRLFVVLGFALLAGGAYAIFDGWPYRVLERGFTEVILGGLSLVAGLILLALAAVLAEVRRLKGLVSGAMAVAALSEPRSGERPVPNEAPARLEPALDRAPEPEKGHVGIATTLAAGAGAAVVAGAFTGLAKPDPVPDAKAGGEAAEADKAEASDDARAEAVAAEPSQAPAAEAGDIDDWLLPPVSPVLDVAPSDVRENEGGDSGEADETIEKVQDEPERPSSAGAEEASQPVDETGGEAEALVVGEPEARQAEEEQDEAAKPEAVPVASPEDRLWWPRIDRPAREETASIDDEFNALRDQLTGVVNAPDVEPPQRDRDTPETAEGWMAPRPWPPVTQPRDPGPLSEAEPEAVEVPPEAAKTEPASAESLPTVPEPESDRREGVEEEADPIEAETSSTAKLETSAEEAKSGEGRAASEEGVIGAYQVGETQFTMFADGSIHARTPDGDYTFASMDELKAYLASEKDKLEPGAPSI